MLSCFCQWYIGDAVIHVAEQGPKLAARSCGGIDWMTGMHLVQSDICLCREFIWFWIYQFKLLHKKMQLTSERAYYWNVFNLMNWILLMYCCCQSFHNKFSPSCWMEITVSNILKNRFSSWLQVSRFELYFGTWKTSQNWQTSHPRWCY